MILFGIIPISPAITTMKDGKDEGTKIATVIVIGAENSGTTGLLLDWPFRGGNLR